VELAGPQHDKFAGIKVNASMFNKLRKYDGNGKKFGIEPFDDSVLGEMLPLLLSVADEVLPQTKSVNRKSIKVFIPEDCAFIADRLIKHLKKGQRIEFATNIAQFMALFLMRLLGFNSYDEFRRFVMDLKLNEVNCVDDFIDILQRYNNKLDGD
jgi:hypothetical protein